jgi:Vitamin K epoxide reductase family
MNTPTGTCPSCKARLLAAPAAALPHNPALPVADAKLKLRREFVNNLRNLVFIVGLPAVLLFFLVTHGYSYNLPAVLLLVFKTVGLVTTVLLLVQHVDAGNPLIRKLCGNNGKRNCNALLSSMAARLSTWLSWAEVGFFYFAGTLLVLLFNSGENAIMQVLVLLNLLCLPYTFYSVYYQWRAKQWCLFCCIVQALLWLEFAAFLP